MCGRINNNDCKTFWPRNCVQLTKAETSCNHCYWFCYVSAHDQFARYWQSSNEPLRHHYNKGGFLQIPYNIIHEDNKSTRKKMMGVHICLFKLSCYMICMPSLFMWDTITVLQLDMDTYTSCNNSASVLESQCEFQKGWGNYRSELSGKTNHCGSWAQHTCNL